MNHENLLILGVPHAGNHFMLALIPGAPQRHPTPKPNHHQDWHELLEHAAAVVCPMRHPLLVAKSWKKRGKSIRDLDVFWRNQVEVVDRVRPYYICLDKPEIRDDQVAIINEALGLALDPGDWPVLRDHVIHNSTELDQDEREYVCLHHYAAAEAFFDRWYQ